MADYPAKELKYMENCCPGCSLEENFLPQQKQIENFKTSSKGARMFCVVLFAADEE